MTYVVCIKATSGSYKIDGKGRSLAEKATYTRDWDAFGSSRDVISEADFHALVFRRSTLSDNVKRYANPTCERFWRWQVLLCCTKYVHQSDQKISTCSTPRGLLAKCCTSLSVYSIWTCLFFFNSAWNGSENSNVGTLPFLFFATGAMILSFIFFLVLFESLIAILLKIRSLKKKLNCRKCQHFCMHN